MFDLGFTVVDVCIAIDCVLNVILDGMSRAFFVIFFLFDVAVVFSWYLLSIYVLLVHPHTTSFAVSVACTLASHTIDGFNLLTLLSFT